MHKIEFRSFSDDDSIRDLALCLYQTDPYIYPHLCNEDLTLWSYLVGQCLDLPGNIFARAHLFVAHLGGEIAGVLCAIPCGQEFSFVEGLRIPAAIATNVADVDAGYFRPVCRENLELTGWNIINLCTRTGFRGLGVGKGLLRYFLSLVGMSDVWLEVISSNTVARDLYEKSGFCMVEERNGYIPEGQLACALYRRSPST